LLAALAWAVPSAGHAQARYRVTAAESFRQEAGADARLLAQVSEGTEVEGGDSRDGWVEVTLQGWIWERSLGPSPEPGFDFAVRTAGGENLRDAPNGRVLARLLTGFRLDEVSRRDGWVQVRRSGWMPARSLRREGRPAAAQAPATPPAPAAETRAPPAPSRGALDRMLVARGAGLYAMPGPGDTLAAARGEAPVTVLARANGWARVQLDAWVRETDLSPARDSVLVGVSGAEVRTDARAYVGRLVRWRVQFLALQTADALRRDMTEGQRYVLARGPLPEAGFIYVLIPPAEVSAFEGIAPLSHLDIVARVRTARSRYLGNPILELVDYETTDRP
jgi:hypothetical protein